LSEETTVINPVNPNKVWESLVESQEQFLNTWFKGFRFFQPVQPGDNMQRNLGESFQKMMEEWINNQRRMIGFWQDNLGKSKSESDSKSDNMMMPFMPAMFNPFLPFLINPRDIPRRWNDLFEDWYKVTTKNLTEISKTMPWMQSFMGQENVENTFKDMNFMGQLYDIWNKILTDPQNINPNQINEVSKELMETNRKFMEQTFSQNTIEPFNTLFTGSTEIGEAYTKTLENFMSPWMNASTDLQTNFNKAIQGDRNAYIDFLKTWQEAFQDSFGKLFNVPTLGYTRETNEKLLKSIDAYLDYIYSSSEFAITLYKVGFDAMDSLMNKIKDSYEEGNPPETFKEFYDLWIETNEEVYTNMFRQEGFAKMLGDLVDTGVSFKRRFDDLVMDVFDQLPIPTDNDMESVYRKIYEINNEMKRQKQKLEEFSKQLDDIQSKHSLVFTKTNT